MPDCEINTVCSVCGVTLFHVLPIRERHIQRAGLVLEHIRQAGVATCEELRARSGFKHVGDSVQLLLKTNQIEKLPPRTDERYPCYRVKVLG